MKVFRWQKTICRRKIPQHLNENRCAMFGKRPLEKDLYGTWKVRQWLQSTTQRPAAILFLIVTLTVLSMQILRCESLDNPYENLVGWVVSKMQCEDRLWSVLWNSKQTFKMHFRTEFRLEEGGDLAWKLSPGAEQERLPFFACETYELQVFHCMKE